MVSPPLILDFHALIAISEAPELDILNFDWSGSFREPCLKEPLDLAVELTVGRFARDGDSHGTFKFEWKLSCIRNRVDPYRSRVSLVEILDLLTLFKHVADFEPLYLLLYLESFFKKFPCMLVEDLKPLDITHFLVSRLQKNVQMRFVRVA